MKNLVQNSSEWGPGGCGCNPQLLQNSIIDVKSSSHKDIIDSHLMSAKIKLEPGEVPGEVPGNGPGDGPGAVPGEGSGT